MNLMKEAPPRARYTMLHALYPDVVLLMDDDDGGMTVTNDAEAVVRAVLREYPGKRIIYRDTERRWDELRHNGSKFTGFAPLNEAERRRFSFLPVE